MSDSPTPEREENYIPQLEAVPSGCMDCIMAFLLFGDGAVCLAGHGRIYWKGNDGNRD